MNKLKIGFIQPVNSETLRLNFLNQNSSAFSYLKSYIDKYLGKDIIEYRILQDISEIQKEKIDILGVSAYTPYFYHALKIMEKAKSFDPELFIILGGYHITALPSNLPDEADVGVIGEGEQTFLELISLYINQSSRKDIKKGLRNIKGIVFKDNSELVITEPRDLIKSLDTIPAFDKNFSNSIRSRYSISPYLYTSRGCPFECSFCSVILNSGRCFREFSPAYVVEEIKELVSSDSLINKGGVLIKNVAIADECFGVNRKRLKEIIDLMNNQGINNKLTFGANVRANMIDEDLCRMFKSLNIRNMFFGAESGSQRILSMLKKNVSLEDNERACTLLSRYNIRTISTIIVGVPSETEEEMKLSLDFVLNNIKSGKLEFSNVAILTPFPGTYWWNYAMEQGWVDEQNMNWTRLDNMLINSLPYTDKPFEQWRAERENYGIYLNKYTIPEKRFYDLLGQFTEKLADISVKREIYTGT